MPHSLKIGDIVKVRRTHLEAEVVDVHQRHSELVLCGWIDDADQYQEVYFNEQDLIIVKSATSDAEACK